MWPLTTPVPEKPIEDANMAVGIGYGESKWVSERILQKAAEKTPLQYVVVRIGQLTGGFNGSWDTNQWFPAMVRAGEMTGLLPGFQGVSSIFIARPNSDLYLIKGCVRAELAHGPSSFANWGLRNDGNAQLLPLHSTPPTPSPDIPGRALRVRWSICGRQSHQPGRMDRNHGKTPDHSREE